MPPKIFILLKNYWLGSRGSSKGGDWGDLPPKT